MFKSDIGKRTKTIPQIRRDEGEKGRRYAKIYERWTMIMRK
jgi:hypothetical protein